MKSFLPFAFIASLALAGQAAAADITLINVDPPGKGLNDPTALAPEGGNLGTTIGEQRRIVYQFATDLWGAVLDSKAEIRVEASFAALECKSKTVLGQAGPTARITVDQGLPGVIYARPLADALAGKDLDAGTANAGRADISSQFNASYGLKNPDGTDCAPGKGWYYGLDGKTPKDKVNFLATVMHEIAHGLGFLGSFTGGDDIYNQFVYDNNSDKPWTSMDFLERYTASTGENVVFTGRHVVEEAPLVLGHRVDLNISGGATAVMQRFGTAAFGPYPTPTNFNGPLVIVNDGTGDTADACETLPAGSLTGKVAFVNRGTCDFEAKAAHAQDAGALAVVIGNVGTSDKPRQVPGMATGSDPNLVATIPTLSVNLEDADIIRASEGDTFAQLIEHPNRLEGADDGSRPYLYAPDPYDGGSSFSHFDTLLHPNALMEPAINDDLVPHVSLDLTPALFADEGWVLNPGNGVIGTCDTGIRAVVPGGVVLGANIQAMARSCLVQANGSRSQYLRCVTDHATKLRDADLISNAQVARVRSCAAKVNP